MVRVIRGTGALSVGPVDKHHVGATSLKLQKFYFASAHPQLNPQRYTYLLLIEGVFISLICTLVRDERVLSDSKINVELGVHLLGEESASSENRAGLFFFFLLISVRLSENRRRDDWPLLWRAEIQSFKNSVSNELTSWRKLSLTYDLEELFDLPCYSDISEKTLMV